LAATNIIVLCGDSGSLITIAILTRLIHHAFLRTKETLRDSRCFMKDSKRS
jgi:hypothetical protein